MTTDDAIESHHVSARGRRVMPGRPRVPSLGDALALLQAQTELMADLPATVLELQRAVRGLGEVVTTTRETMLATQRVAARLEEILDDIDGPVRNLRPGLEKLATVLDDPVIERIPATLTAVEQAVGPVAAGVQRVSDRLSRRRKE
jgi:hypothetical protein